MRSATILHNHFYEGFFYKDYNPEYDFVDIMQKIVHPGKQTNAEIENVS